MNMTHPVHSAPATHTLAVVSLIAGILTWVSIPLVAFMVPAAPLTALVAVITGHMARSAIRRQPGRYSGDGMAIGGLILGYLQLALTVLVLVVGALFFGGILGLLFIGASQ